MGNRGCLHDDHKIIKRQFQGRRWIICLLEFKGRKRSIMTPGHYTELFFFDEATALAAGHRPCAECQRVRFNLFRELWTISNPEITKIGRISATDLDLALHKERIMTNTSSRRFYNSIENLPDGTFVTDDDLTAYLVFKNQLLMWSPAGYKRHSNSSINFPIRALTPASIILLLSAGYPVGIHPSAYMPIE